VGSQSENVWAVTKGVIASAKAANEEVIWTMLLYFFEDVRRWKIDISEGYANDENLLKMHFQNAWLMGCLNRRLVREKGFVQPPGYRQTTGEGGESSNEMNVLLKLSQQTTVKETEKRVTEQKRAKEREM